MLHNVEAANTAKQIFTMRKIQKEVISKADDKKFFDLFWKSKKVTNIIGIFGQFISGITEFNFIFKMTGGDYEWNVKNFIPAILGLIAVYIFEVVGVRVFLVKIIRQIVAKDFKKSASKTLFFFNLIFVFALCGVNIWFSILGQKSSFHSSTNIRITDKTFDLEQSKISKIEKITANYSKKESELKADYKREKSEKTLHFDGLINEYRTNRWTVSDEANKSKYNKYTAKIDKAGTDKTTALNDLETSLKTNLSTLENQKKEEIKTVKKGFNARISDIEKTENADINLFQNIQKYTLPILITFIILSWISIIYVEIFYKGSEQKIEVKETSNRPVILIEFSKNLYNKIYHFLYKKLVNFSGNEKYEYDEIQTKIVKIKSDDLLKSNDENEIQIAASTRQIGFNRNENESSNDNRSNDNRSNKNNIKNNTQNMRICQHCGNSYVHNHHKQKYCNTACRQAFWQKKTGKKLILKSKKK